jgi:hypothetical protein
MKSLKCAVVEFEEVVAKFVQDSQAFVASSIFVCRGNPLLEHPHFHHNCKGAVLGHFSMSHSIPVCEDRNLTPSLVVVYTDNNKRKTLEIDDGAG